MSFLISKSKKAFKPKAPAARRPEPPAAPASVLHGSQDSPHADTSQAATTRQGRASESIAKGATDSVIADPHHLSPQHERQTRSEARRSSFASRGTQPQPPQGIADSKGAPPSPPPTQVETAQPRKKRRIDSSAVPIFAPELSNTPQHSKPSQSQQTTRTRGASSPRITRSSDNGRDGANALLQLSQESRRGNEAESNRLHNEPATEDTPPIEQRRGARSRATQKPTAHVSGDDNDNAGAEGRNERGVKRSLAPLKKTRSRGEPDGNLTRGNVKVESATRKGRHQRPDVNVEETVAPGGSEQTSISGTDAITPDEPVAQKAVKRSKKPRKIARPSADSIDTAATSGNGPKQLSARSRRGSKASTPRSQKAKVANVEQEERENSSSRKLRETTPEDAEAQKINVDVQTLGELPTLRIGRLGPRELKLKERDEQRKAELKEQREATAQAELEDFVHGDQPDVAGMTRQEKAELLALEKTEASERQLRERVWKIEDEGQWSFKPPGRWDRQKHSDKENDVEQARAAGQRGRGQTGGAVDGDGSGVDGGDDLGGDREDSPFEDVFQASAPGFRIVDGKIVMDPSGRALAAAPTGPGVIETRVQTDIDRRTTEASFRYREPRGRWDTDKLDAFYEGLQRWGTDFGMVATWVPGMSRNQVKRKYTQEERAHPDRIRTALARENRLPTTVDEIVAKRGRPLSDPAEWQADIDRREADMRRRAREEKEAAEELLRTRGVATAALGVGIGGGSGANGAAMASIEGGGEGGFDGNASNNKAQGRGRGGRKGRGGGRGGGGEPEVVNMGMF